MRDFPIIVTRAEPGAEETYQRLKTRDLNAIKSPVLQLIPDASVQIPEPETLSGLIFTSANGVRTYTARDVTNALPVWCVGPATAAAARDAGIEKVFESAGNALDLAAFITERSEPSGKPLLHVANNAAKGDLKRALAANGYSVDFCPLYAMKPATILTQEARTALLDEKACVVLIHSAKGADAFAHLARETSGRNLIAVAISEPASRPLRALRPRDVFIAESPNEDGLFAAFETALATLSA